MNPNEPHMYSVEPRQVFSSLLCTQKTVWFMQSLLDGLKQREEIAKAANQKSSADLSEAVK